MFHYVVLLVIGEIFMSTIWPLQGLIFRVRKSLLRVTLQRISEKSFYNILVKVYQYGKLRGKYLEPDPVTIPMKFIDKYIIQKDNKTLKHFGFTTFSSTKDSTF